MKFLASLIFVLIFLDASAQRKKLVIPENPEIQFINLLNEANEHITAQRFKDALDTFEKALVIRDDTSVLVYAAYAAYNANNSDRAITYLNKYFSIGGREQNSATFLVNIFYEIKKDYLSAKEKASDFLRVFPSNDELRILQLYSLIKLELYNEAIVVQNERIKRNKNTAEDFSLLGTLYQEIGDTKNALGSFNQALVINPNYEEARQVLIKLNQESAPIPQPDKKFFKVALVIGVRDYSFVSPLRNSLNDAIDMANALKVSGFHVVEIYNPKTKRELQEGIKKYFSLINGRADAVGLVFYSGHGMQVDGVNYLMPTESNPATKADLEDQSVKMEYILTTVEEAGNPLNVFIIDACRNNPFRSFSRSVDKGLSQVNAPNGSYVLYATAPGSVASDGTGRNGLFTSKLLKYISSADLTLDRMFNYVARDVQTESGGTQVPWFTKSYYEDFYPSRN
jgi:tetratricopeptide (TPR) repeat protein